jgi:UDP-3-O-[3-hydroxymyristoyl] glucosamine N-acyltransferase
MREYRVAELAKAVGGAVEGDGDRVIRGVNGINEAGADEVTFVSNPKYASALATTAAGAVVVSPSVEAPGRTIIRADNPYVAFARILTMFAPPAGLPATVSPLAFVHENAAVGEDVGLGPFAVVEEGAAVGRGTSIGAGTYVGRGARVGAECIIYPNVTLREAVVVGDRCIIHSGTVIGSDGFGFATEGTVHHKIPQLGTVVVEDDVEIGANCAVDRATMGETRIGRGTKIDNLVQLAHNVTVGGGTLIAAQTGIAGSTKVGEYCVFGGQVGVVGHIVIGDRAVLGAQSGVAKSLPGGRAYFGYPAKEIATVKKREARIGMLERYFERVKRLEKELKELKEARG